MKMECSQFFNVLAAAIVIIAVAAGCKRDAMSTSRIAATNQPAQTAAVATNDPITFKYLRGTNRPALLNRAWGPVFWVTNHTSQSLVLHAVLETKQGFAWVPSQPQNAIFHTRTSKLAEGKLWIPEKQQPMLEGHEVGYATVGYRQTPMPPTNAVWRLRTQIGVRQTGVSEVVQMAKMYPTTVKSRLRSGDTNISLDPFPDGVQIFLPSSGEIVTEEITGN